MRAEHEKFPGKKTRDKMPRDVQSGRICVIIGAKSRLTGPPLCLFHREEGQEGEEGPVNPPQPPREKERSHSKSKKTRREHRHADRGVETTAPVVPSAAALPPQTPEERQVTSAVLGGSGKNAGRSK